MGKRLNALDIAFLGLETQRTPVNVASLQIFEKPKGYKGHFTRDLLDDLMTQPAGPPFNMRLSPTITGQMPQWVEDQHFDLDYHVRLSALPQPGTMEDLLSLAARLHSRVLDRERPLWEFHVIEGLENDRFAVYMKMHHAGIDGMGGNALLEACLSTDPQAPMRAPWQGMPGDEKTSRSGSKGLAGWIETTTRQLKIVPDLGKLIAANGAKVAGLVESHSPAPFTAPKSLFNGHISGARRIAIESIPLSEIKALGKAAGATVNDIVLATCAGALRRYLKKKRSLPDRALVASVPVSIRQIAGSGNQITYVAANLATQIANPVKRLDEIRASTSDAKEEMASVRPAAAMSFAVMAQGLVAVLNRLQIASRLPPPANVVISNVPGPRQTLYFGGARMLANYPLSVLVDGQALNITVVSYCDSVDFGLMACRDSVPDVKLIADHIVESFEELREAVAKRNLAQAEKQARRSARKRASKRDGKKRAGKKTGKKRRAGAKRKKAAAQASEA